MAVQAKHVMSSTLVLSLLTLAGCKKPGDTPPQPSASATPAVAAQPYVPPTADQLQQMVAPIALFPDKLVGQVLAGATYPAQITAADQWVQQNPALKGDALQAAEANQPWDVSVKSLTAFPSVLDQMAGNIQWTTALGEAYANDPNDVMNAIQVMRVRAQQAGTLKNSPHLRVSTTVRAAPPPADTYVDPAPSDTVVYAGPPVIPPPPQTIVIEPAEPDVVYVPHYNPTVVYGAPVPVYPGWTYREPAYVTSDLVTTGAITFGLGVLVGAAVSHHHDWGWNAWGVNWGGPGYGGGWHRPAVVYNNTTYVTKSVTVVNRVNNINNINNVNITNNHFRGGPGPLPAPGPVMGPSRQGLAGPGALAAHAMPSRPAGPPPGPMSMPHFTARDAVPGTRPPPGATQAMHMAPPAMAQHDFRPQSGAAPVMRDGRGAPLPSQAMMDRQHLDAARERATQAQQRGNPGMPPARTTQQAEVAQAQQRAPMQHADAGMQRPPMQHAEGQTQRPPMQNAEAQRPSMQRAEAPTQRPPMQFAEAQQQRSFAQRAEAQAQRPQMQRPEAQMPHRDTNALDHAQAHAIRQDVAAMHPRPAERPQPQAQHAERHEQAARHESHDKRDHHG